MGIDLELSIELTYILQESEKKREELHFVQYLSTKHGVNGHFRL